jgi:hypothetical protein
MRQCYFGESISGTFAAVSLYFYYQWSNDIIHVPMYMGIYRGDIYQGGFLHPHEMPNVYPRIVD